MPRPAANARPTAAGASNASAEGSPTSIHPRDAAHVSANGTAAIVHARVAQPSRHPRRSRARARRRRGTPIRVARRRVTRSRSAGSARARASRRPAGRRRRNPTSRCRPQHRADHGRFSTNAMTTATERDREGTNAPRHPPTSTAATRSTRRRRAPGRATKGTIATATATTRPRPSTSRPPPPGPTVEGSEPARSREAESTHGITAYATRPSQRPLLSALYGSGIAAYATSDAIRGPDRADRRGEPPHADEADEQRQQGEQRVEQAHLAEQADRAERDAARTRSAPRRSCRARSTRHPTPNERMRSVAERGNGASWPIAGTPCVISSRLPNSRKAIATTQASSAVRRGPGARVSATLRPTGRGGCEPLVGGRSAQDAAHLRAPPRLQVADLVVGNEPDAVEVPAAAADVAVVAKFHVHAPIASFARPG